MQEASSSEVNWEEEVMAKYWDEEFLCLLEYLGKRKSLKKEEFVSKWEEMLEKYSEPRYQQRPVMDFWDKEIVGVSTKPIAAGEYLRIGPDGNIRLKQSVVTEDEEPQVEEEDICDEAKRITTGDRQSQYGPPNIDLSRTAELWTSLFGRKFLAHEVCLAMICLKLSRMTWSPEKRDSIVDICGYARCAHLCIQDEIERGEIGQ